MLIVQCIMQPVDCQGNVKFNPFSVFGLCPQFIEGQEATQAISCQLDEDWGS